MRCRLQRFALTKAVPLAISRGTTAAVEHLLVQLEHGGITGFGETGGLDTGHRRFETDAVAVELESVFPQLEELQPQPLQALEPLLAELSPPARCGLDLALHDWWGKRLGQPLHRLWGLDAGACVATSVTLGLGEPAAVLARLERWWAQLPATRIKLKLGSPDGIDHDRQLLEAVAVAIERRRQSTGAPCELQVDANGGWDLAAARAMFDPLQRAGVVLLEQPLAPLADPHRDLAGFAALKPQCPMPLVADESCWDLQDLLRLAPHVDGINIKLLKSGGLAEALLMARTARRLGLGVMLGCYSDGGLLNGAAAQLLPLVRWPDLDSHLNLVDDPFSGGELRGDTLLPANAPGVGIMLRPEMEAKLRRGDSC
ncbi:dipeptide epimerase [Cyanobium sp. ATX 6A2]|uniref:dipeptide epimerase n=1 Tax=Cyanobium sp. ATX 6A2 TaxID=2823700 RepID=UPI0020CB7291|nr:dipeptide epimerase [Cyanobium sp. ATX 6A2]MCP9886639.1 dipeptide epimerase [Cyanobium sp. ATX 6A2]